MIIIQMGREQKQHTCLREAENLTQSYTYMYALLIDFRIHYEKYIFFFLSLGHLVEAWCVHQDCIQI